MDEHPQPGLLPIIPPFPAQQGPSPLIPVIILIIVGVLRWALLQMLEIRDSFEIESYDWSSTMDSVQSHLTITAVLIPICLLLAIHAFGMPQGNQERNGHPPSPITQKFWSSILLLVVIAALLLAIPIRSILHSPWQEEPDVRPPPRMYTNPPPMYANPPPMYTNPGYRNAGPMYVMNGICQELGILQRRCENWKGYSRDSVCRELAMLQKRCVRSGYY